MKSRRKANSPHANSQQEPGQVFDVELSKVGKILSAPSESRQTWLGQKSDRQSRATTDVLSGATSPGTSNKNSTSAKVVRAFNKAKRQMGKTAFKKADWASGDQNNGAADASGKKYKRNGFSPRQRTPQGRMFSASIREEEEDEEQAARKKKNPEEYAKDCDAVIRVFLEEEEDTSVANVSDDLEERPKSPEEQAIEADSDKSSSDSDEMYDTDLEEEFSDRKFTYQQTGKEIYEYICKKEGLIPVSFLLTRFGQYEVSMPHHGLGPDGGKALAKALVVNSYIERLDLSDNDLQSKGGMSFGFMLYENIYITDLDLSENAIGISGGITLAKALKVNKSIRRLILRGNQLTDKVAVAFAEALTDNEKLHVLDLSYNELGEMGGLYLGAGLSMNYGLAMLNLKWNAISGKGAVSIAHALSTNETLTSLNISWNSFGYTGAMALSTNLKRNEVLKHLDLRNNHLNEEAVMKLMPSVATHQSLVEIKIGQNPIGEAGVREIFEAVSANQNIIHLGLEDISVPHELLSTIQKLEKDRGIVVVTDKKTRSAANEEQKNGMDILMEFLQENSLRLKDMFFRLDKDHSGDITREEFKSGLKEMGIQMDFKQLDKLINEIDKDDSDTIDYREITQGHRTARQQKRRQTIAKINLQKKDKASLFLPELDTIKQSFSYNKLTAS